MQYPNIGVVPDVAIPYVTQAQQTEQDGKGDNPDLKQETKPIDTSTQQGGPSQSAVDHNVSAPETIAVLQMKRTLLGMLIDLIRRNHQMKLKDIVEYINKNKENLIRLDGRKYVGSTDRIVSGALYSSNAFVQIGHSIWSLNNKIASEVETDIYERFLSRERHRKRKRRATRGLREPFNPMSLTCSPEQMELCLTRVLRDIRQESGVTKPLDSGLVQSHPLGETPENGEEEKDDPFSFLQQDLFENASLQDCENEMKEKLGDEGFCFVIQFFNFFREYLTHPTEMAARTLSKIDSVLQEIQNDSQKPAPSMASSGMSIMPQPMSVDIGESGVFDISKARRASIQDTDGLFNERELNLNLSIGLPNELSNYNQMSNIPTIHWSSQMNKETSAQSIPIPSNSQSNQYFSLSMFPSMAANMPSNMISQLSHGMYEVGATNNDLVEKNIDSSSRPNEEEHASLYVCCIKNTVIDRDIIHISGVAIADEKRVCIGGNSLQLDCNRRECIYLKQASPFYTFLATTLS